MKELIQASILSKIQASSFFAMIAAFLIPIKALMLTIGGAIALDTIIGIWRARRKKEKITSRKLSQVVSKMLLYQAVIVLFFCIEKYILVDFIAMFVDVHLFLTKLIAALLTFIEIQSINESIENVTGESLWTKIKEMFRRAKEIKEEIDDFKESDESNV